jgi:hypothetical protein
MRSSAALAAAAITGLVALTPGRVDASWGDTGTVTGEATAMSLAAPDLQCSTSGVSVIGLGVITSATVSWTPSSRPTSLSYTAKVVEKPEIPVVVSANSSATLSPSLLSALVGTDVTLRVTGALPETEWTVVSDQRLRVGALGLSVTCR